MSSTSPVPPAAPKPATAAVVAAPKVTLVQEVEADAKKVGVWLTPAHIVLLILLAVSLFGGLYLYESKSVAIAQAKADAATQVAAVVQASAASDAVKNAAQQEESKEVEAALQAANLQLQTANTQLAAANTQLAVKLATQQKVDATLSPTDQSARWQALVPQAVVTPTATGFNITAAGGLATVQALEELPMDRQQIANLNVAIANDDKTIVNDTAALASEKTAHASDVAADAKALTASKAETKKANDDFSLYKKKAHRNILRAFGFGFVAGFFTGHALGF